MTYKIIDIEGIGKAYAPKLTKAGIVTVAALLKKLATNSNMTSITITTMAMVQMVYAKDNGVSPAISPKARRIKQKTIAVATVRMHKVAVMNGGILTFSTLVSATDGLHRFVISFANVETKAIDGDVQIRCLA